MITIKIYQKHFIIINIMMEDSCLKSKRQHEYQSSIKNYRVHLKLSNDAFTIKLIEEEEWVIYEADLTRQELNQMDPSILLTFGSLECMYQEIVQIVKGKQDIEIGENGIIKLRIFITLKSGVQRKDLVFETQRRQMNEVDILESKIKRESQKADQEKEQLKAKINSLQKEFLNQKQYNKKLASVIQEQNQQIKKQKEENSKLFLKMKEEMLRMKNQIDELRVESQFIKNCRKIRFIPNKGSKCQKAVEKVDYFILNERNLFKKGNNWAQLLSLDGPSQYSQYGVSFYEVKVKLSKNYYICLGYGQKNCVNQMDSKWSEFAITMFLLDRSVLCCGKKVREQDKGFKIQPDSIIRVVYDWLEGRIDWVVNRAVVASAELPKKFMDEQVFPLVIACEEGDMIECL